MYLHCFPESSSPDNPVAHPRNLVSVLSALPSPLLTSSHPYTSTRAQKSATLSFCLEDMPSIRLLLFIFTASCEPSPPLAYVFMQAFSLFFRRSHLYLLLPFYTAAAMTLKHQAGRVPHAYTFQGTDNESPLLPMLTELLPAALATSEALAFPCCTSAPCYCVSVLPPDSVTPPGVPPLGKVSLPIPLLLPISPSDLCVSPGPRQVSPSHCHLLSGQAQHNGKRS